MYIHVNRLSVECFRIVLDSEEPLGILKSFTSVYK